MQDIKCKLVFSNWVKTTTGPAPLANGLHPLIVDWMKRTVDKNPDVVPDPNYGRIYELEGNYQTPGSGVVYHHINLFYYFKLHYGIENVVSEEDIDETDNCIYFLPYELERSNIDCFYNTFDFEIENQKVTYKFSDTLSERLLSFIKRGKVRILLASLTEFSHGKDTLVKLENYFSNLGIPPKYVNYLMGNEVTNYLGEIVQGTSHASLQQQAEIGTRYPIEQSSLGYYCDFPKLEDLDKHKIRPKKFLCWNRAMNRPHRLGLAYLAIKHNLLKDGLFSFLHGVHIHANEQLASLVNEEPESLMSYVNKIKSIVPYELDTQTLNPEGKEGFQSNENNKKEFYTDTYLHLTSETLFDADGSPFMSEKTFRPILNLQPFIYVGNYRGLEELRRLGFKTFDGYIDESYDLVKDPKERFALIEKEILKFTAMNMEELHNWYYSLTDILLHNQRHFLTFKEFNPLEDFFARYQNGI
jgi:hypothetical protein